LLDLVISSLFSSKNSLLKFTNTNYNKVFMNVEIFYSDEKINDETILS